MFLSVGSVSVLANTIENSQSKNISLEDVQKVFPEMKKVSTIPEGVEPFEIDSVEDLDELTEIVSQYGYNNEDISTYGFSSNYKSSGAYSIGTNLKTYALIESDLFELYTNSISMSYVVKDCLTVTNYNCIIR